MWPPQEVRTKATFAFCLAVSTGIAKRVGGRTLSTRSSMKCQPPNNFSQMFVTLYMNKNARLR